MSSNTAVFRSPLAHHIEAFLKHHRALGKRFDTEESALKLLDRYLVENDIQKLEQITARELKAFVNSRPRTRPRSYNHLLSVLQRLFRWLAAQQVIAPMPLDVRPRRATRQRRPFLFEPAHVERLLELAAQLPDARYRHRGATYRMVFALMYGLGLRVGEASRLSCQDVDFERRCLLIRQTKFAKTRWVPFGPRMADALQAYVQLRHPSTAGLRDVPLFSITQDGCQPLGSKSVSRTFSKLLAELKLTVPPGVASPRLHCLRHSFAVSSLLRWYREGLDPAARLFKLSVFLGHVNPASTAVYLTITTELLQEANMRFHRFAESIVKGVHS